MKLFLIFLTLFTQNTFGQTAPGAKPVAPQAKTSQTTEATKKDEKKKDDKAPDAQAASAVATEAAPNPEETKTLKKIVVTGSYIKKAPDAKAPTPVTITTKEKLQETATFTVAGALSDDVAFNGLSPDDVFLSMHGQSSADNLILLNGMRLPKVAGGSDVNIDFIPAAAMERTETLKDGASALYGSDALSGVINIVTAKDYQGTQTMYRLTTPQHGGGQEAVISLTHGGKVGKHHYMGIFQFRRDTPAYSDDDKRSRIVDLLDPNGAGDYFFQGALIGDAGIGSKNCPSGHTDADGLCQTDLKPFGAGQDKNYYMSYVNYGYDFTDTLKLNTLLSYSRRAWYASGAALPMTFANETALGRPDYSIPVGVANSWGVTDANGAPLTYAANPQLRYRATEELGTSLSKRDVDNYIAQVELTKELGSWDINFATGYGLTFFRDVTLKGNADKAAVFNLISTNQFNPFKTAGAKDDIRSAAYQSWFQHTSDVINPKLIASGPLTSWLSMAGGVESQWQSFKFGYDPLTQTGGALGAKSSNENGSRNVYSSFLELDFIPVKQLEIQVAGRFDEYSDFGSTVNPKLGVAAHPTDKLTFRASYGSGFKAPDLLSIFQGENTNPTRFRDEVQCKIDPNSTDCNRGVWPVTIAGNKDLGPETAQHYNVGTVVTPTKSLVFGADYWHVDGEDGLSALTPAAVTLAESRGFDLSQYGVIITRDPGTKKITKMYIPTRVNAGIFRIRGVDLSVKKRGTLNTKMWGPLNMVFTLDHSHILSGKSTSFPIEAIREDYNLGWSNIMAISASKENNFFKVQARTSASGDVDTDEGKGLGKGSTSIITVYDFHYERFLKNESSINFGIRNIFDTNPTAQVDGSRFVYAGGTRSFYMGYTKEF